MSSEVESHIVQLPSDNPQRGGFKCFCGDWFPSRDLFDGHLRQHPGKFTVCKCCNRILPKGSRAVDEYSNFVSAD